MLILDNIKLFFLHNNLSSKLFRETILGSPEA
jgi:hypothetical protein